jgi:hypothetical protein
LWGLSVILLSLTTCVKNWQLRYSEKIFAWRRPRSGNWFTSRSAVPRCLQLTHFPDRISSKVFPCIPHNFHCNINEKKICKTYIIFIAVLYYIERGSYQQAFQCDQINFII